MLACRRTYTSSSRCTPNTAAVSMASRERSEDESGRGGEIVTIALVPAGALRCLIALLHGSALMLEASPLSIWGCWE